MSRHKLCHITEATLQVRADLPDLPPGIAGRVSGIALTYDVVDTYDTMFARGCAKRSIDTRVAARKVPLLMDHDRSVKSHVGVVAQLSEVGDALMMVAEILDTEEGREALEYAKAVMAANTSTGFSIGFVPRRSEWVKIGDKQVERFTEIELREVSITPFNAVPGAEMTAARAESGNGNSTTAIASVRSDDDILIVAARAALDAMSDSARLAVVTQYVGTPASDSVTANASPTTTPAPIRHTVSMQVRADAVRASYATHTKG